MLKLLHYRNRGKEYFSQDLEKGKTDFCNLLCQLYFVLEAEIQVGEPGGQGVEENRFSCCKNSEYSCCPSSAVTINCEKLSFLPMNEWCVFPWWFYFKIQMNSTQYVLCSPLSRLACDLMGPKHLIFDPSEC